MQLIVKSIGLSLLIALGLWLLNDNFLIFKQIIPYKVSKGTGAKVKLKNKGGFKWHKKMIKAKKEALQKGGSIFIYFSADWCMPCIQMEKYFFPSNAFKKFVKKYSLSLLLYDMNQDNLEGEKIYEKYFVHGLPTIIVTDRQGNELDKVLGFRSTEQTIEELKEIISNHDNLTQ